MLLLLFMFFMILQQVTTEWSADKAPVNWNTKGVSVPGFLHTAQSKMG
jgi:hypothetical protein